MKLLAVDDEKTALDHITSILAKIAPEAEIIGCRRGEQALEELEKGEVQAAFLDISLRDINGIKLARRMKEKYPLLNIIFTTGHNDYAVEAFELHASGYVLKPLTEEKIRRELEDLRHPAEAEEKPDKLRIHTFGNFEVYDRSGIPMSFQYAKSKEMLAYLVDRCGTFCTNSEIMGILWGEEASDSKRSYLKNLRTDLSSALEQAGYPDVLIRRRGMIAVIPDAIDCDYYDWLKGNPAALNAYRGEYMVQYGWSEFTNSQLAKKQ